MQCKNHTIVSKLVRQKDTMVLNLRFWGFILSEGSADTVLRPSEVKMNFALCLEQDKKK